ncbi:MAG: acylphosphatase [Chloroflexota bacterium]|jgi:acylphosphatase|nr:acylphosphatase [Chloroflexota bacterium]
MTDPARSEAGPREPAAADPRSSGAVANGRIEATVRGRVQGVGFRWFASRAAARLELDGWVANQADGSVKVVAEGPEAALDALVAALGRGPSGAVVDEVQVQRVDPTGSTRGFQIRSGAHSGD